MCGRVAIGLDGLVVTVGEVFGRMLFGGNIIVSERLGGRGVTGCDKKRSVVAVEVRFELQRSVAPRMGGAVTEWKAMTRTGKGGHGGHGLVEIGPERWLSSGLAMKWRLRRVAVCSYVLGLAAEWRVGLGSPSLHERIECQSL